MAIQNRSRKVPRKRALVIHHNARKRKGLVQGLSKSGWETFGAEDRADGMPLMFQTHPSLILLEELADQDADWDTFRSIRLFSDAPVIILTDQPPSPTDQLSEYDNVVVLYENIPVTKTITMAKSFWQNSRDPNFSKDSITPESWNRFYSKSEGPRNEISNDQQT